MLPFKDVMSIKLQFLCTLDFLVSFYLFTYLFLALTCNFTHIDVFRLFFYIKCPLKSKLKIY